MSLREAISDAPPRETRALANYIAEHIDRAASSDLIADAIEAFGGGAENGPSNPRSVESRNCPDCGTHDPIPTGHRQGCQWEGLEFDKVPPDRRNHQKPYMVLFGYDQLLEDWAEFATLEQAVTYAADMRDLDENDQIELRGEKYLASTHPSVPGTEWIRISFHHH